MTRPQPYPLLFRPILKEKVWGGRGLETLGKELPAGMLIGESWELADLPESIERGRSVIANGPLEGLTLRQAIGEHRERIMGPASLTDEGGFPLLIKYLDARENLSVQVHPDAAYVSRHPEASLKSEAWIVVAAEPGAVIYKGVRPEVTAEAFATHIAEGTVADDLVAIPVRPGDCHYLPSGTCHALGEGLIVAEVQTPSDTTFRVFDWGREGRTLHVRQALECIAFGEPPRGVEDGGEPVEVGGLRTTPLTRTEFFAIERIEAESDSSLTVVTSGLPVVWMMVRGGGWVEPAGGAAVELPAGATVLMPAELDEPVAVLREGAELLRITLASPIEGLIA